MRKANTNEDMHKKRKKFLTENYMELENVYNFSVKLQFIGIIDNNKSIENNKGKLSMVSS